MGFRDSWPADASFPRSPFSGPLMKKYNTVTDLLTISVSGALEKVITAALPKRRPSASQSCQWLSYCGCRRSAKDGVAVSLRARIDFGTLHRAKCRLPNGMSDLGPGNIVVCARRATTLGDVPASFEIVDSAGLKFVCAICRPQLPLRL